MKRLMPLLLALGLLLIGANGLVAGGSKQAAPPESADGPLVIHALLVQYQQPPDPNGVFWKDMESKFNVKYTADWVQDTAFDEKLALVLSTNDLPDLVQITNTTAPSVIRAIEAGQIKDLTPHLDFNKYQNLGKISASAWINSKYKGRNYVFPRSRGQYNDSVMIRGDLLKKYNLPKPTTLEQFADYLEVVVKEGGVGIPFWIQKSIHNYFQPVFGPGAQVPLFTADRTGIVPNFLCESYALAVNYVRDLYSRGLVAREFAMLGDATTEDYLVSGKGGMYFKNFWHRYRMNEETRKSVPNAEIVPLLYFESAQGTSIRYDKGFYGGIMVNAKMSDARLQKLLVFFDHTSDPANYNYFMYGIEGRYWNMVDGFPQLTEEGKREVNNSFYCPYTMATDMYGKVDSPLAPPAYNRESREMVKELDVIAAKMGHQPFMPFEIISSSSWANFWAMNQDEFMSFVVDVITSKRSVDDLRAYQQRMLRDPLVQAAMKEFKQDWDEFGLDKWTPPSP